MTTQTLSAGRLDTAGIVATRTWTRVPVVLAAADDTIRIPVPPGVGRFAYLRIESGVETVRPVVDGVQADAASVSADWRLSSHGQLFTPSGPAVRDAAGEVLGRSSIDIVPTLQGSPTLPATVYLSAAIQEGAGAVALGARIPNASDIDLQQYGIFNAETPDGTDPSQLATVEYVEDVAAGVIEDLDEILFLSYAFDTVTSPTAPATPASGAFRLNHATPASATGAYLNETDSDGIARGPEIATWSLNYATAPSVLTIRSRTSPTKFAKYYVSGANTDSGTYDRLVLTYIDGNGGGFSAAEPIAVFFTPAPSIAVGYQPLNTNLTSFAALSGVADRLAYFTGAGALALATLTGFARSLLAAADIAALWALIHPDAGTVPLAADYGTTITATSHTVDIFADLSNGRGISFQVTSGTASERTSSKLRTATDTGWIRITHAPFLITASTHPIASTGLAMARSGTDTAQVNLIIGTSSSLRIATAVRITGKDAATVALAGPCYIPWSGEIWGRIDYNVTSAGNITVQISPDGGDSVKHVLYQNTPTTAFGGAGNPTEVGLCSLTAQNLVVAATRYWRKK